MYRKACKWVLRCLHGSIDHGLHIQSASGFSLTSISDADWVRCVDDPRSANGFYVFLGPNIVSWSSRKQKVVRRSNTESWYKALAHTAAEVTWLQALLKELQVPSSSRPLIWCDNIRVVLHYYKIGCTCSHQTNGSRCPFCTWQSAAERVRHSVCT